MTKIPLPSKECAAIGLTNAARAFGSPIIGEICAEHIRVNRDGSWEMEQSAENVIPPRGEAHNRFIAALRDMQSRFTVAS